jgi:hypothetical protein
LYPAFPASTLRISARSRIIAGVIYGRESAVAMTGSTTFVVVSAGGTLDAESGFCTGAGVSMSHWKNRTIRFHTPITNLLEAKG